MVETSSIAALLKRLDAVTTKLEDQAMASASAADVSSSLTGSGGGAGGPRPSQSLSVPPGGGNGGSSGGLSLGGSPSISGVSTTSTVPVIEGYEELMNGPLKVLMELSHAIGGLVEEQAGHVSKLLAAQREMIMIAASSHKPPMTSEVFRLLLEPTQQELTQILEIREKNRSNAHAPHLSTLAEGIRCFGWVTIESKPGTYIGHVKDTAQTHASKVIAGWQDKDENHVHWAHAFIQLLTELQAYVRKYHPAGLVWNPKEHFENNNDVVLENAELGQSVFVFSCQNSTIQIKTKVTNVVMDSCAKTGLCVESLVTSLDVINSKSVQLQILGTAPTVSLDKVESCMVYLSRECMDTTGILTTKCSGVNVLTPAPVPEQASEGTASAAAAEAVEPNNNNNNNNNEYVERLVPEQLFTRMVDGKLVTSIVELSS
ncbi:hypothetical protein BGZ95_005494 [Linnemannia exigua]|uniref:Adenylyl cyclase-associated protein n=1 Tax=Linnemannia exigua TaxID=604196 RepID=A0AAD4H1J1_9FUNG|nr:hypothetical protein BGZ95_005494 [Linnemannia exigua]